MMTISEAAVYLRTRENSSWIRLACLPVLTFSLFVQTFVLFNPVSAAQGEKPSTASQEKPYALIFGTVWGPDERPVYGVKVKIRRASDKRSKWELYSNHTGEFAQRLPAGKADYVVWADLKGLKLSNGRTLTGQEVTVHIENDERTDIGLHLK